MDLFVGDDRVARLESHAARLTGNARLPALVELAWHLRERDTRRARALALEAAQLLAGDAGSIADFAALMARVQLTLAECDALFLEAGAARREAQRALSGFESAGDDAGAEEAQWLLARLDPRFLLTGLRDPEAMPRRAGTRAIACHRAFMDGLSQVQSGDADAAVEAFCRAAQDAQDAGLRELSLEARLGAARAFASVGDDAAAHELATDALEAARANGWRRILVAAHALLSQVALRAGRATDAVGLMKEAQAVLSPAFAGGMDAAIGRLLAEAQLAAGEARAAFELLGRLRRQPCDHTAPAELAHLAALHARAAGSLGDRERAMALAQEALRLGRDAQTRAAQMEALRVLGELHAAGPSLVDQRSAIAFVRHALDVAEDIGAAAEKASLLRELARMHERCGDLAAALAAERAARTAEASEERRAASDRLRATRAHEARERLRLEREHQRTLREHEAERLREVTACREAQERLCDAGEAISQHSDAASIAEALERHIGGIAEAHAVALFVFDAEGENLRRHARESGRAIPVRDIAMADVEPYVARCARERRELLVEVESGREGDGKMREAATLWFAPVMEADRVLGVLGVQSRRTRAYGPGERIALRTLCGYTAIALARGAMQRELGRQHARCAESEERLQRLATSDALTGLSTRAHFFAVARERLERMRREGGPCGLIVADLDGFRSINDTRGQRVGDRVLAAVARTIAQSVAGDDVAGRIGGEEFAVLLPETSRPAALVVANRLRAALETQAGGGDGRLPAYTVSIGVATHAAGESFAHLMARADGALYQAKAMGRNRVVCSEDSASPSRQP